jgi:hypothetical protein
VVAAVVFSAFYFADVRPAFPALTGDEPHYLALADALAHGTLDVRAAYQDPSGPRKWLPPLKPDQTTVHDGHLRSMRMPLLPLLLAPAMWLGSLTVARLTMVLLAALLFDQLWRLLGDLRYRGAARAGPWLAALTAFPVLGFATQIYPEIPGALGVVVILRLLLRPTRRSLVAAAFVAGLLPWLIVRFTALAIGFAIVAAVLAARPEHWRGRGLARAVRARRREVAMVLGAPVASAVATVVYVRLLYGSFDPRVVYPPGFTQAWTPWHAYVEGIGSLFGAVEGLVPYAPAFLLGLVGVVAAARRYRAVGWFVLVLAAIHLFVVVPTGFWGVALPGRFLIVLVPLLVVAMAEALRVAPVLDIALGLLVALQLVLVPAYHDVNGLILRRLPRHSYLAVFPTVDDEPGLATFSLPLAHEPGPVAEVVDGSLRAGRARGSGVIVASGPLTLRPGPFGLAVRLTAAPAPAASVTVAQVVVTELPSGRVLAARGIYGTDLATPIDIGFAAPRQPVRWTNRVEITIATTGAADVDLQSVRGGPTIPLPPRDRVIHDGVPVGAAWSAAVVIGAVAVDRRGRRRDRVRARSSSTP